MDLTVTRTAMNAGAETVRGLSLPSDSIVNVAGTRALVVPPFDPPELVDPLELIPAPPEARVEGALVRDFDGPWAFVVVVVATVVDAVVGGALDAVL